MKKLLFPLIILILLENFLFAQAGQKIMIDSQDKLYNLDIPIYEGIEEFQAKIDKIRSEENREPLGLVLCGGSARAFAHIGVLKALENNKITPDFIVANSMGAVIGMLYAYGFSPDKIQEIISNITLTSYFEPVVPIHGGVLSVRKFRALLNELLGQESTDLSNSAIPILVLTEDLYSKRQIWHASGDFANTMSASFAMTAFMEPTRYTLNDSKKTKTLLIDAGSIDIIGLETAYHFSPNLIVSSAFYDAKLNFNNMLVIINRNFSIGKERKGISDIKKYNPVLIRNEVENFSFMAFDKAQELSQIGYQSTQKVLNELEACPHSYNSYEEVRKKTNLMADNLIHSVLSGKRLTFQENYFGLKIWPFFPKIDYPDYYLYDQFGLASFIFGDSSKFYGRLGANIPFNHSFLTAETLLSFYPFNNFESSLLVNYSFDYKEKIFSSFYASSLMKYKLSFLPYFFKSVFVSAEYDANQKLVAENILFKSGLDMGSKITSKGYLTFTPYYFVSGNAFDNLSQGIGSVFQSSLNASIFSKKEWAISPGIGQNLSARYAISNFSDNEAQTSFYNPDFYRAKKPDELSHFVFSGASELYLHFPHSDLTFAEMLILQQVKFGAFYDFALNGDFYHCAGGFLRAKISLVGLYDLIFEGGCGHNLSLNSFFAYFEMKNRM